MIATPAAKKLTQVIIALVAWFAVILQLVIMMNNNAAARIGTLETISNFLSYFTILSNILVAVCLTTALIMPRSAMGRFFSNYKTQSALTLYIFIVGLVYNLVLRGIWEPEGWQLLADNLLHVVVPLIFLAYWLIFIPRKMLQWSDLFPWLIFPLLYLIYSLIRGAMTGWYPYPFLHAGNHGYGNVALNSFFVLIALLVTGLGIIALNRRGSLKEPKPL